MNHNEFEAFIEKQRWIFAKTYADKAPHEYCLRKECYSDAMFVEAVNFIRENGVHMNYFKYDHIYYFIGGKMYWTGDIHVGTGILAVHDIFSPIPDFMHEADTIFCDPPCSKSNINSFYTKAEKETRHESYEPFHKRFWEVIDEIAPKVLFLEVFKSNKAAFIQECDNRYKNVTIYDSMYYRNRKNVCWIIQASNEPLQDLDIQGRDEEDVIKEICTNATYDCIGDPCMGKGLVAFYANKAGRKFVGTELNKYRLAVACERVSTGIRGTIN